MSKEYLTFRDIRGYWLMFATTCLFFIEQYAYGKLIEKKLDTIDDMLFADLNARQTIQHVTDTAPGYSPSIAPAPAAVSVPQSVQERGGIPPDPASEIEQKITERKARKSTDRGKGASA